MSERSLFVYYLALVPTLLVAVTCHEYAHARVALFFGDRTAYDRGRVSLNPLVHLDLFGTLALLLFGFGWGKPVPVNLAALRYPRADLWVSAAGPATNLCLAFLGGLPLKHAWLPDGLYASGISEAARIVLPVFVSVNVFLALLNFLPVGPLDGAHVAEHLLPRTLGLRFRDLNRQYGLLLVLFLLISPRLIRIDLMAVLLDKPWAFFMSWFTNPG